MPLSNPAPRHSAVTACSAIPALRNAAVTDQTAPLSLFQARSTAAMAAHLDDLALLVPYVLTRLREDW